MRYLSFPLVACILSAVLFGCSDGGSDAGGPGPSDTPDAGHDTGIDGAAGTGGTGTGGTGGSSGDAMSDSPGGGGTGGEPDGSTGGTAGGQPDGGIDFIVPPLVACAPTGDTCALGAADDAIHASFRKDYYLPKSDYNEDLEDPVLGGRFQVSSIAQVTGEVTSVKLNGVDLGQALENPSVMFEDNPVEWYHVWPKSVTAGDPVWVHFHSRNPFWDTASSGQIEVETSGGTAMSGSFPVQVTPVPITYVTTNEDRDSYLIHVRNTGALAHEVTRLLVNGRDVTTVACIPKKTIDPGETVLWTVPWCTTIEPGTAWTVVVEYEAAPTAAGSGRVVKPHYVVESWNNSGECPFPGAKQDNFLAYQAAGFDTAYHHGGQPDGCDNFDNYEMLNVTAPQTDNFYFLATWELVMSQLPPLTDTSGVAGIATGDESDGSIYQNDDEEPDYGKPTPWGKAKKTTEAWDAYPELPTFNGAKTNRYIGSFAGMADIQGIDLYAAACAPHITAVFDHPPLRGPYDYLLNARNNHMPLPTWLYTQGLSPAWNVNQPLTGVEIHVQPDPQEILVQALSVVAAGGKGLMWFQANQEEAEHAPARWQAISKANWMIRGVRDILREGDITGSASGPDDVIVEVVRGTDAMVLVVINLNHAAAPDDVSCNTNKYISESAVPHWVLNDYAPTVELAVPEDVGLYEIFEVTNGTTPDPSMPVVIDGRTVRLEGIPLSNAEPARLYVFAMNPDVRGRVGAAAKP